MTGTTSRVSFQASRLTCVLTICLVFLTGTIAGAIAMNLGASKWMRRSAPFYTEAGKEISLQKWKRELDLTPDQTRELEVILDDFAMYYRNVVGDGKARILKILNEDQKKKFEKLLGSQRVP